MSSTLCFWTAQFLILDCTNCILDCKNWLDCTLKISPGCNCISASVLGWWHNSGGSRRQMTTPDCSFSLISASFADGKKRSGIRLDIVPPFVPLLSNYAIDDPLSSPARIIQNLMKFDELRESTSLVHLSPPVAAARHICLSVKGRRLDRLARMSVGACVLRSCGAEVTTGVHAGGVKKSPTTPALTSWGWLATGCQARARDLNDILKTA